MRTGIIFFLLLVSTWCGVNAQNFDQYKTLVPAGPVPRDFTEKSFLKVASEVRNIPRSDNRKTKSAFYLESTFGIDDFLSGGSVLFNDPVSLYLNKVLEEVTRPFPHLRNKIRIYAVKSAVVNAFTTNNGIIFVNLGLLARLENEAQLAFVIAHEVVHFEKQHVLNAYIHSIDIDRGNGAYRNLPDEGRNFAKSTYSKELETEADWQGCDIFLRSGYSADSVQGVFEILRYADLAPELGKFEKKIFESGRYVFHDSLARHKTTEKQLDEDYDDSGSSHPNVRKRKEAVRKKLGMKSGGQSYIVSSAEFKTVRKIAGFELVRIHLLDHQFLHALNLVLNLRRTHPSSQYLQDGLAKAWYGIALHKINGDFHINDAEWSGEPARLTSFARKLTAFETGVLAMRELYKSFETSGSAGVGFMLRDIMHSLNNEDDLREKFVRPGARSAINPSDYRYTQFAFADVADPSRFFDLLDAELAGKEASQKKKSRYKIIDNANNGGIGKIVVVNPRYRKIDRRKKQRTRHVESEKVVIDINEKIHASAGRLDLLSEILNVNTLTTTEARTMQSNSILSDWLQEQFRSGEHPMISPIYDEVLDVARIHKTEHFLWMGCLSVIEKKRGKVYAIAPAVFMPSIAPIGLAYLIAPKGKTFYFALLFNVKTQELELSDVRAMSMKDSGSLLESNIYYTLFRLKQLRE
jgi:hypothetical protein